MKVNGVEIKNYRDVEGFKGLYRVSDEGDVFTKQSGKWRWLKPGIGTNGYLFTYLRKDGESIRFSIHRLVFEVFSEIDINEFEAINHLNHIKHDNRLSNLEGCSLKENTQWAVENNRISKKGFGRPSGHLITKKEREEIKKILQKKVEIFECQEFPDGAKIIPGHSDYLATPNGEVFSLKSGGVRKLKQFKSKNGYLRASLRVGEKDKLISVHRLIALTFVHNPDPEKNTVVNHLNNIRDCNFANNLEWTDHQGNIMHSVKQDRHNSPSGEEHHNSQLTKPEVVEIKKLLKEKKLLHKEIAEKFGIARRLVSKISQGKLWKHVLPDFLNESDKDRSSLKPRGEGSSNSKLTEDQVTEMKILFKQGKLKNKEAAKIYGVSVSTIEKIKSKHLWSHIKIE